MISHIPMSWKELQLRKTERNRYQDLRWQKSCSDCKCTEQAKELTALGFANCPICVAKTQYSLTDDQTKLGAPTDFEVTVRNLKISAGAGFIVALTGEIMTMPGLPKVPAATKIDVDESGKITGLF